MVVAEATPKYGILESNEQLIVTWAVTDANPLTSESLTVDGNAVGAAYYGPFATSQINVNYWGRMFGPLGAGTHNYTIQVTDSAGKSTSYSSSFTVQLAAISLSGVVVAEATPQNGILESNEQLVITWAVTDVNPLTSESLTVHSTAVPNLFGPVATSDSSVNYWAGVFGPLSAGTHNYTIQVSDGVGNTTSYTSSFDVVAAPGLVPAASALLSNSVPSLTDQQLQPIVTEAERRLTADTGGPVATAISGVAFRIADLPNGVLGEALGKTIDLSPNAAGHGWFVRSHSRRRCRVHRRARPRHARRHQPSGRPAGRSALGRDVRDGLSAGVRSCPAHPT